MGLRWGGESDDSSPEGYTSGETARLGFSFGFTAVDKVTVLAPTSHIEVQSLFRKFLTLYSNPIRRLMFYCLQNHVSVIADTTIKSCTGR